MAEFETPSKLTVVQDLLYTTVRQRGRNLEVTLNDEGGFSFSASPGDGSFDVAAEEIRTSEPSTLVNKLLIDAGI